MPENDVSIIDLERGLSVMSQHSWNEQSPTLNNGCFFGDAPSALKVPQKNYETSIHQLGRNTQSVLNNSSANAETKISGTVDDYRNVTLSRHASNFIENVGFQGVRYIFMTDAYWLRRLMWIILCLAASGYCWYVTVTNWNTFFTYPTATKTEVHYTDKMPFPALTLCNYNIFQKYRLTEEQIEMVEDMYKPFPIFENETGKDPERYDHIDMKELMINTSYEYFSNIGICFYKGKPCNYDLMYTKMRDIGVCLTFDPSQSKNEMMKYQIVPGHDGGFSLGASVWEENWTHGPFMNYDGLVIMVHDPSLEVVLLQDHGTTLEVGTTTNLILTRKEVNLLQQPYGQCGTRKLKYHEEYTEEACRLECNTEKLIEDCGCRHPYMPGNDSVRYCNNVNMKLCEERLQETGLPINIYCDCPPKCNTIQYDLTPMVTKTTEGTRSYVIENYMGFDLQNTGVLVNVYYSALSFKTETQEATYTVEKLLCDVGGASGLFLGASFMSFFEVVDFLLYVFYLISAKWWKKSDGSKITPMM